MAYSFLPRKIQFYTLAFFLFFQACSTPKYDESIFHEPETPLPNLDELQDAPAVKSSEISEGGLSSPNEFNVQSTSKLKPLPKITKKTKTKTATEPAAVSPVLVSYYDPYSLASELLWKNQDIESEQLWKSFSPSYLKEGEIHVLNVNFAGIPAATTLLEVKPSRVFNSRDVYHFHVRAKTSSYYKWVYELNDTVDSLVDKKYFFPLQYTLMQREKNKTIDDFQEFDRFSHIASWKYKKIKEGTESKDTKNQPLPLLSQDYLSSFFFLRGLPLKVGDHYVFPVTTKSDTWLMSVKVEAVEKISVPAGEFSCLRLSIVTKYTGELAKKGTMQFWLSDAPDHVFVKARAEVKIGSVEVVLAEYRVNNTVLFPK
jgi:hypothetical protein